MSQPHQQPADADFAPRCYRHPDRQTFVSCTRCDRPICPTCLRDAPVGFQCPDCVGRRSSSRVRTPTLPYGGKVVARAGLMTLVLIGLNVVAFIATAVTSPAGFSHNESSRIFGKLVLNPTVIAENNEFWRFLGSAFLHFGVLHLAVNMFSLFVLGPALERVFGAWRYLSIYLLGALGGALSVYLFDNRFNNVAGASGAIFGLFGALIVVYRKMGLNIWALVPTILINVYITLSVPGISWLGHLGGLVAGAVAAAIFVYAPRMHRALYQVGGVALLVAIMVGLTVWRTGALDRMLS
jgi:membrane associated rhomboid family serine protease